MLGKSVSNVNSQAPYHNTLLSKQLDAELLGVRNIENLKYEVPLLSNSIFELFYFTFMAKLSSSVIEIFGQGQLHT